MQDLRPSAVTAPHATHVMEGRTDFLLKQGRANASQATNLLRQATSDIETKPNDFSAPASLRRKIAADDIRPRITTDQ